MNSPTKTTPVPRFNVTAWRTALTNAAVSEGSSAKKLLDLALAARGVVDLDTAREAFSDAYAASWAALHADVALEAAKVLPGVRNRVSEAMAVLKAVELPSPMPANLSRAADACRKLAGRRMGAANGECVGEGEESAPVAVVKLSGSLDAVRVNSPGEQDETLEILKLSLEALSSRVGLSDQAKAALSSMMELSLMLSEIV